MAQRETAYADEPARQTATGDWFGHGQAMRDAGLDLRVEQSQFYQGLTRGGGTKDWQYGGKWDVLGRIDLAKWGLWEGISLTAQGNFNYGESVNGLAGSLVPANAALFFPGIDGADASDIMALYLSQDFGKLVSVSVGKFSLVEFARGTPLRGGGGVDTFWNVNVATPVTGDSPPTIYGAMARFNTEPVSFALMMFDAQDATNTPLFSNLFEEGVNIQGTATLKTSIAGRTGYYGVKGIYSTREGPDFSQLIPPPGSDEIPTEQGSYYIGLSMQQYLIQDSENPARGWGVFAEIAKGDGNPNILQWSTYVGLGGSSLIPGRPDDKFGVAWFHYGVSEDLKEELAPFGKLQDEAGVEVFYNIAVTPWFRIMADVQFVTPALGDFPDASYAGIGTYVKF